MTKMTHFCLHVSHLLYKTACAPSRCMLMKLQEFSDHTDTATFP